MGADYYQRSSPTGSPSSDIPIGIGCNSHISGAIIDKNARVGNDVIIKPFLPHIDLDGDNWVVRDGIVVIPKNATLPPGTIISPESV
jgi:glucose-1-phosphate adenylyltransferase